MGLPMEPAADDLVRAAAAGCIVKGQELALALRRCQVGLDSVLDPESARVS